MINSEIERKYLLRNDSFRQMAVRKEHIAQGYLSVDPDRTIRVRHKDEKAYLTVKGQNREGSISHFEWEKEITVADAEALLKFISETSSPRLGRGVGGEVIEKDRYLVSWHELTIEVDVFHGQNEGLVLAEIELPSEDYRLPKLPDFIGEDVTSDPRYYNSYLAEHPYTQWQSH